MSTHIWTCFWICGLSRTLPYDLIHHFSPAPAAPVCQLNPTPDQTLAPPPSHWESFQIFKLDFFILLYHVKNRFLHLETNWSFFLLLSVFTLTVAFTAAPMACRYFQVMIFLCSDVFLFLCFCIPCFFLITVRSWICFSVVCVFCDLAAEMFRFKDCYESVGYGGSHLDSVDDVTLMLLLNATKKKNTDNINTGMSAVTGILKICPSGETNWT